VCVQKTLFKALDGGIGIQTDLKFVAHSVCLQMHHCGRFMHKITPYKSDHDCENKGKTA